MSYLGLVPSEYSSGERRRRGRALRSAHPRVQSLLVQAAWYVWRSRHRQQTEGLRRWTQAIADRRGKRVAAGALGRRLARILFAMWRDETGSGTDVPACKVAEPEERFSRASLPQTSSDSQAGASAGARREVAEQGGARGRLMLALVSIKLSP